jgi:adenylate kinase family enzyme
MAEPAGVRVLLITGPSGVGKTAVASELSWLLESLAIAHSGIEWEALTWSHPPMTDARADAVLAAAWRAHREHGSLRLVLAATLESVEDLRRIKEAIGPAADVTVFRLHADASVLVDRVVRRELGGRGESLHREMALRHAALMDVPAWSQSGAEIIETGGRSPREIASEIFARSGW